jgi:hypothetical protein
LRLIVTLLAACRHEAETKGRTVEGIDAVAGRVGMLQRTGIH